eukprot:CAMPEP_0180263796 /NCGR_PEP_ID=MMETSP0987-20121128/45472_1 /TAXON_ID=697907 /ORGANISM="non described non described, Strain CCMP2293" /LENGTH=469 /DNA_ID=CAMNT_0022234049 /DNA_START=13 /DNA_END=1421 /DNA_ORIENTATION=+
MGTVAHWMCCLWYLQGGEQEGWIINAGMKDPDGNLIIPNDGYGWAYSAWISAFYWSITTMSTIGYGDISATTSTERSIAVVVMVLGCCLFAWTTGRITNLLTKTSICGARFNYKMEEINEWMEARNLSTDLVERTKSFYMLKFPTMRIFNEMEVLDDLDAGLRKEVYIEMYQDIIKIVPLFRACNEETQREICFRLKPIFRAANTTLTNRGDMPDAMYIVRFGSVEVLHRESTGGETDPPGQPPWSTLQAFGGGLPGAAHHQHRLLYGGGEDDAAVRGLPRHRGHERDPAAPEGHDVCLLARHRPPPPSRPPTGGAAEEARTEGQVMSAAEEEKDTGSTMGLSSPVVRTLKEWRRTSFLNSPSFALKAPQPSEMACPTKARTSSTSESPAYLEGEHKPLTLGIQLDVRSLGNFSAGFPKDEQRGAFLEMCWMNHQSRVVVFDETQVFEYKSTPAQPRDQEEQQDAPEHH